MLSKQRQKQSGGFSYLETLLALSVVSFIFLGAYQLTGSSLHQLRLSTDMFTRKKELLDWNIATDESVSCKGLFQGSVDFIECQKELALENKILILIN